MCPSSVVHITRMRTTALGACLRSHFVSTPGNIEPNEFSHLSALCGVHECAVATSTERLAYSCTPHHANDTGVLVGPPTIKCATVSELTHIYGGTRSIQLCAPVASACPPGSTDLTAIPNPVAGFFITLMPNDLPPERSSKIELSRAMMTKGETESKRGGDANALARLASAETAPPAVQAGDVYSGDYIAAAVHPPPQLQLEARAATCNYLWPLFAFHLKTSYF